MSMESYFTIFEVPLGWMGLVGCRLGILRIHLPMMERKEVFDLIQMEFAACVEEEEFFKNEVWQIQEYFGGIRKVFQFALDLSSATLFQKRVYETLLTIPFGEIRTYAWVARTIGDPKALRAVGNANGKNRWPLVVPCHRVVGSNGFLTGFSAPGGVDLKARLLSHEGIQTRKNRIIPSGKRAEMSL